MKVAFALSGGGNLGAMQAGGMRALVEAGIEPELLTGSSIGALNAAFYATHPGIDGCKALETAWSDLRRQDVFRLRVVSGHRGLHRPARPPGDDQAAEDDHPRVVGDRADRGGGDPVCGRRHRRAER